jgi:predicted metal-dependent HD superfamily phosphohydrolase
MSSWEKTWSRFVEPSHFEWTRQILFSQYSAAYRRYHNLTHVDACLDLLGSERAMDAAALALLWHDVVYVPADKRNEELSARLLDSLRPVLTVSARVVDTACAALLATKHHDAVFSDNLVSAIVVDIDLSILGSDPATYDAYVQAIREEFAAVSDEAWRVGRSEFLAGMLKRSGLFRTTWAHAHFERQAGENMARELKALETR